MKFLTPSEAPSILKKHFLAPTLPLVIELNHEARQGAEPQVMAIASTNDVFVLDFRANRVLLRNLISHSRILAAFRAKELHKALARFLKATPERWACIALSHQLLTDTTPAPTTLVTVTNHFGLPIPPDPSKGFEALAAQATLVSLVLSAQIPAIKKRSLTMVSRLEAAAIPSIANMELAGLPFNAKQWASDIGVMQTAQSDDLSRLTGPHNSTFLREILHQPTLKPLLNSTFLQKKIAAVGYQARTLRITDLRAFPSETTHLLADILERARLLASYGAKLIKHTSPDSRVRTTYEQIGASTGRVSSTAPNLQSIPAHVALRNCFHTTPERSFVIADYSMCELRILAELSCDNNLRNSFEIGSDLHATIASQLWGTHVTKDSNPHLRQQAKVINFGIAYGITERGLAQRLGISEQKASELMSNYFKTFPAVRAYLESAPKIARLKGYCETITGRKMALAKLSYDNPHSVNRYCRNMPIQGTSADIIKSALYNTQSALKTYPSAILCHCVHDEIIVECDRVDTDSVSALVKKAMEASGEKIMKDVEMVADVKVSSVWSK